jgi:hypothetical protein
MNIKILDSPKSLVSALRALTAWADELRLAYAWVTSGNGRDDHWRTLPIDKIKRAVVGTDFDRTEPHCLELLCAQGRTTKVIRDPTGTFHPKVILGSKINGEAMAIVGSSNFTSGGFRRNTELNILLTGLLNDTELKDIETFIDSQWSKRCACFPDAKWFEEYKKAYQKRPKSPSAPRNNRIPDPDTEGMSLDIGWKDYYSLLIAYGGPASGHPIFDDTEEHDSYLQIIATAREGFRQYGVLARMPENLQNYFFGMNKKGALFGKMQGKVPLLDASSAALDAIPLEGDITDDAIKAYFRIDMGPKVKMAKKSRLLTLRRPDRFLTVNNGNKLRMMQVFGVWPRTADSYLELHKKIWEYPWFRVPAPEDKNEEQVCDARVALLDALLYEPKD